jgi:hypothetical protein
MDGFSALPQVHELLMLGQHNARWDVMGPECFTELHPLHLVVGWQCCSEVGPPCANIAQELLGCKESSSARCNEGAQTWTQRCAARDRPQAVLPLL